MFNTQNPKTSNSKNSFLTRLLLSQYSYNNIYERLISLPLAAILLTMALIIWLFKKSFLKLIKIFQPNKGLRYRLLIILFLGSSPAAAQGILHTDTALPSK